MIAYGHIAIMVSGELFDRVNGNAYNLHTRWVSDFAAKYPQGIWIKAGIVLTCIATFQLYHAKYKSLPLGARNSIKSWLYHLVPLLMIIGLIIVISYEVSRPRAQWDTRGIWPFQYRVLVNVPKHPGDWVIEWYHSLGFRMFVSGFFLAVGGGLFLRCRNRDSPVPIDWLILLSAVVCAVWLFTSINSLPGILQRFLLASAFVWLWREADMLGSPGSQTRQKIQRGTIVT